MRHSAFLIATVVLSCLLTACPQPPPPESPAGSGAADSGTAGSSSTASAQAPADTRSADPAPASIPSADMPAPPSEPTPPPQAKRAAGEEGAPLQAWRGFGNEPFWEARVDGDTLVFSTPDQPDGRAMKGRRVPSLVGYVFLGKDGDRDFNLGLTPGECSDGMSDNRHAFTATFTYGGTTYRGCGEAAK
jgi:uncharacterized membrane protein